VNPLSPRWGLSISHFPHGLRRGLHSYAAARLTYCAWSTGTPKIRSSHSHI
jgi:hypothetical protein